MVQQSRKLQITTLLVLSVSFAFAQQPEYTQTSGFLSALSVFYGILSFTIIVTLAQFFISKDKAYLYYGFYVGVGFFLYGFWQEIDYILQQAKKKNTDSSKLFFMAVCR